MKIHIKTIGAVGLIALGTFRTSAEISEAARNNWPQWRGPLATGVAPKATPPTSWSETEHIRWKIKIPGNGTATPVIWNDHIFIETAIPTSNKSALAAGAAADATPSDGGPGRGGRGGMSMAPTDTQRFAVLCLDRQTGRVLWQKTAREEMPHEGHHRDHGFSSFSPITDGSVVIAYFGSRGLYCYDFEGNLRWSKDLGRMQTKMGFGEGGSAALFGKSVVVKWDHEGEDFIAAFDRDSGKELWRQARNEDTSWSTPLVVEHGTGAQVVTAATGKTRSYDLATGKQVWEGPGLTPNAIPTPVAANGVVYVTSGFRGNALYAIQLGATGDVTGSKNILWQHAKGTPYVPSPLLSGENLYFFSGNDPKLSCFDAKTGQPRYEAERIEGFMGVYSSPVAAAGRVYLVGRNGTTVVIRDGSKLEVLATNKLDEQFEASPALAGKELFLRGHQYVYCIAE